MKTKSRDFYVDKHVMDALTRGGKHSSITIPMSEDVYEDRINKIMIAWEEPEKSVTITESEFDAYFEGMERLNFESYRKKLFGDR
jgi:hypothetical protein